MKLFFYDLETTGTDCAKCAIHQMSGKISINGKIVEEFNYHLRPFPNAVIDGKALEVGNVTEEQIMEYDDPAEVYKQLCTMLMKYVNPFTKDINEKFVTVGYNNTGFDDNFLYYFFNRYSDIVPNDSCKQGFFKGNFFNKFLSLDVMHMAKFVLAPTCPDIENYKLGTVAKYTNTLSLNEGELHNAMYDIDTTINLFKKLYKNITPFKKKLK